MMACDDSPVAMFLSFLPADGGKIIGHKSNVYLSGCHRLVVFYDWSKVGGRVVQKESKAIRINY